LHCWDRLTPLRVNYLPLRLRNEYRLFSITSGRGEHAGTGALPALMLKFNPIFGAVVLGVNVAIAITIIKLELVVKRLNSLLEDYV